MTMHAIDSVHWYLEELGAQVVAKSGIPSDRYHFGKLITRNFQKYPDFVLQIDGATNETESFKSALNRSVRCAVAFKAMGLKTGDVIVLIAPNHVDLCIPHYAALYLGVKTAPLDSTLGVHELRHFFEVTKPSIIICQNEQADTVEKALELAAIKTHVVTFDRGSKHKTFDNLLKNVDEDAVKNFKPADFNTEEEIALLTSTSGSTGMPKLAALSHKNMVIALAYLWTISSNFPTPTNGALVLSPLHWLSASMHFIFSPVLVYTRIQTSAPITVDHFADLVNKYKPTYKSLSPNLMTTLLAAEGKCDFTCFEWVMLGGSAVAPQLMNDIKRLTNNDKIGIVYGLSEVCVSVFVAFNPPNGSLGKPLGCLEYRLVDIDTKTDVVDANVPGELWLRGPTMFKGYYNNPEVTAETMTKDGWLKTGDIFYRDDQWNFYFVERFKMLLKYRNNQVAPLEVESVILKHPGVLNVAVTGIPDPACGDLVVACVVPRAGCQPTAQEIKDLVKENLADSKQLRGGVIFFEELPITSTTKVDRRAVKQLAAILPRE